MRQCRGWTKDGKMVKGWYVKVKDKCFIVKERAYIIRNPRTSPLPPHRINGYISGIANFDEVLPSTVGESTGVFDKNDVEIFGRDKVQNDNDIGEVYYNEHHAAYWVTDNKTFNKPLSYGSWWEIIHDNEMLEAK